MPLSGVGELASLTITRSMSRGVMSTRASSEAVSWLPAASWPLTVTTLTCEVPPTPVMFFWKVQLTFPPGARLIGTSKHPLPPESSRSPNLSSTTLVMWTSTSADVLVIVTEYVTCPPGSLTEVGLADFDTLIEPWPSFALVKVHFTVSPASSENVAVRLPRLPVEFASLHEIEVKLQPSASASVDVYVPGTRFGTTICPLSPIDPAASPLKPKLPAAPFGLVCFSTMITASFSFVKTHVTVSPAASAIELGLLSSEHTADSRSQPCGTFSETEYVPGSRSPELFDCPSASEKPSPS